jgi:hypothetical protein
LRRRVIAQRRVADTSLPKPNVQILHLHLTRNQLGQKQVARAYLKKPIDRPTLVETLARLLS